MTDTKKLPPGIYRHGAGYRAIVSNGFRRKPARRHFDAGTPIATMVRWRDDTRDILKTKRKGRAFAGSFEADARKYLRAVQAMTTIDDRTADIERWIGIFGTKRRDEIEASEIRTIRDGWMITPRGYDKDGKALLPYSASTINHRLRALSNLWTVLDGRRAPNPVREVPEVPEPDALPRGQSYDLIREIFKYVSDFGKNEPGKSQKPRPRGLRRAKKAKRPLAQEVIAARPKSKTLPRLMVVAYVGLAPAQIARLVAEDIDLEGGTVLIRRRSKGRGSAPRRQALTAEGVDALRLFVDRNCFGEFSTSSMAKSFAIACRKARAAGVTVPAGMRPYDLRHSFGTAVYAATGSLEATRSFLSHEKTETTRRYALAGISVVQAANIQLIKSSGLLSSKPSPEGSS